MDIVQYKLSQYLNSKEKNIPFEFMTSDGDNIEKIITGQETIPELINKVKKYRTINNTPFSMNTVMFMYIKNGSIEEEEANQLMDEMNFYYSINKVIINTNLASFRALQYAPYKRELDEKIRDLQACEDFLPTKISGVKVYDTRIIDMKVELMFENYLNSVDFFNQFETSRSIGHITLYNENQSLCKVYTASEKDVSEPCWFEKSEKDTPCFEHGNSDALVKRDDNVRAMYIYTPLNPLSSRTKLNPTKIKFYTETKRLYTWIPQSYAVEKSLFIQNLVSHFKKLNNVRISDDSVRIMFAVDWSFDRHLFLDFIFSNPELENIVYMDESQIFTIKKSFNLNFVFQNTEESKKIQVSLNQKDPDQDGKIEKFTYMGNTEYISTPHTQIIIKNAKTLDEAEMVKRLILKMIIMYEGVKNSIQEYYTMKGVPEKKKEVKKSSLTKQLTNHKRNKMMDEDINRPGIARKVQGDSQPHIIAEEIIGDEESHQKAMKIVKEYQDSGIPVIRFPTVIRGHDEYTLNRNKYYYKVSVSSVKDNVEKGRHLYPGIVPYEENKRYPFILIFYKKPLNTKEIKVDLEEGDVLGNNIIIHKDWSVTIVKPSHRSPKSAMSILLNQKIFFSPYEVSLSSFTKEDEKNELYSKNSLLFALMDAFEMTEPYETLKDMIKKTNPVIMKQQFWNYSITEIKQQMDNLLTGVSNLNTKMFVRMIEDYFGINLFTFHFDVHNFYLEIPEHRHVYVYENRDRPTFCAMYTELTPGIPYYKLILLNKTAEVPDDVRKKLFDLRDSIVNYKCEPIEIETKWKLTGQILDVFGKTRVLQYQNEKSIVQIQTPRPMEPFDLKEVKPIVSKSRFDNPNYKIYVPAKSIDYFNRKKFAKFIKEYAKLCYFFTKDVKSCVKIAPPLYLEEQPLFESTIPYFANYDEMRGYFIEKYPFMFQKGLLVIESDLVLKGLIAYVNTNKYSTQPQTLLELCSEPSDFEVYNPFEIILTEDKAIKNLNIKNKIKVYDHHQNITEPYLFRDNLGRLFLFQNVMHNDVRVANRVLQQWKSFKVNTGYYSVPLEGKVDILTYEDGVVLPYQPGIAKFKDDIFFFAPFN